MKKTILVLISFALILTVAGCGFWLAHYFIDAKEQRTAFENLSQEYVMEITPTLSVPQESSSSAVSADSTTDETESSPDAPPRHDLAALAEENPDCVGWITIPDTGIDYPVMYTPDDPEHYLRRDFAGSSASHGTPFLDRRNLAQAGGQNLILYGHNMMDGSMFKPLISYLEPSFRETHQEIYLELSEKQYQYDVLAVVETSTKSPFYTYTSLADPVAASDFRATLLKETDLDVVHQAEGYLTLSTCNNGGGNSRVLVIAAFAGEVTS